MKLLKIALLIFLCCNGLTSFAVTPPQIVSDSTNIEKKPKIKDEYNTFLAVKFKKGSGYNLEDKSKDKYALLSKYSSFANFNLGFASFDVNNKWLEPIMKINDSYIRNFNFNFTGGYFIDDNVAIGVSFKYGFYDTKIDVSADLLDLIINSKDYATENAGYSVRGAFLVKNYIPINNTQRIFLTNSSTLWYGYSYYVGRNVYNPGQSNERLTKSTQKTKTVGIGISPGIMYFMSRGFAFEFAFNPISVYYKKANIINNEIEKGSYESYGLNFEFMPLNIELGFSYYFGLDYYKHAKITEGIK